MIGVFTKLCTNLEQKNAIKKFLKISNKGRKSGLVVSKQDSQSKGCGFKPHFIQILNGNGLKAMPGSMPAPNSGSFMEK